MKIPWVRLVLAISIDGRLALPHGGKTYLGGEGDRLLLEESLAWSDGALIGGGTLRAHCNTCLIHKPQLLKKRQTEGRSDQPISLVVSSQKDFCSSWPFFNQPIKRWLISPNEISTQFSANSFFERQFLLKNTWSETLSELAVAGLSRLVLLGGANLVGSFLQADQIDELQLTFTPKIIGGKYNWIPNNIEDLPASFQAGNAWLLKENKPLSDNELMLRYFRNR